MSHNAIETTLILKRVYEVAPERLWRAWTDATELSHWYVAGTDHVVHRAEADVRVGGLYRVDFGPPGKTPYVETGRYLEVIPPRRLVYEESVSLEGVVRMTNRTVVELRDLGGRTELTITSIGAESWRTGGGWKPAMDRLARYLGEE